MPEQQPVPWAERRIAAQAYHVFADVTCAGQYRPADPYRMQFAEPDILAAEKADLGRGADAVAVDEEGRGRWHPDCGV
jgi:hypothetical protein